MLHTTLLLHSAPYTRFAWSDNRFNHDRSFQDCIIFTSPTCRAVLHSQLVLSPFSIWISLSFSCTQPQHYLRLASCREPTCTTSSLFLARRIAGHHHAINPVPTLNIHWLLLYKNSTMGRRNDFDNMSSSDSDSEPSSAPPPHRVRRERRSRKRIPSSAAAQQLQASAPQAAAGGASEDKKKKKSKVPPQESIDKIWEKFSQKKFSKALAVLPFSPAPASTSTERGNELLCAGYERAAEECRRRVRKIIAECRRINSRYRDPGWDIVSTRTMVYYTPNPQRTHSTVRGFAPAPKSHVFNP